MQGGEEPVEEAGRGSSDGGGGRGAGDNNPSSVGDRHEEACVRSSSSLGLDGWGFAPPDQASASADNPESAPGRERETSPGHTGGDLRGGGYAEVGDLGGERGAGEKRATCDTRAWAWTGGVDSPPLPPSAFFAATNTSRLVGAFVEVAAAAAAAAGSGGTAVVAEGSPAQDIVEGASSRGGSRRRGRRRRRKDGDGNRRAGEAP